ncbi:MAG: hypothetical protein BZY81_03990 [SAR202 cluster bacterium Io17-Chloro-G4]|nr:MAG: hypothetical protein BZY81_03990 [SAR202 cluster bacterium Io17-Chloro-G4]
MAVGPGVGTNVGVGVGIAVAEGTGVAPLTAMLATTNRSCRITTVAVAPSWLFAPSQLMAEPAISG